jgi:hypothetical protein
VVLWRVAQEVMLMGCMGRVIKMSVLFVKILPKTERVEVESRVRVEEVRERSERKVREVELSLIVVEVREVEEGMEMEVEVKLIEEKEERVQDKV